jgi:hypothetical protein
VSTQPNDKTPAAKQSVDSHDLPTWLIKALFWGLGGLLAVVVAFGGYWISRVDGSIDSLDDRVHSLDKELVGVKADLVIVKDDVKNIKESGQRLDQKLDDIGKLLNDRLPKK